MKDIALFLRHFAAKAAPGRDPKDYSGMMIAQDAIDAADEIDRLRRIVTEKEVELSLYEVCSHCGRRSLPKGAGQMSDKPERDYPLDTSRRTNRPVHPVAH